MTSGFYCDWFLTEDYYETDCQNQIEIEDKENIEPTYCPFCGGTINFD